MSFDSLRARSAKIATIVLCLAYAGVLPGQVETFTLDGVVTIDPGAYDYRVTRSAPYSAVRRITTVMTESDGRTNEIEAPPEKMFRDAQGRTRIEQDADAAFIRRFPNALSKVIQIGDPVSGYLYALDPVNRIVHRTRFSERPSSVRRNATDSAASHRTDIISERLGPRVQDGITLVGTRVQYPSPTEKDRNGAALLDGIETWVAPDLNLLVLMKSINHLRGGTTSEGRARLDELNTASPDPQLFLVPLEYEIVDHGPEPYEIANFTRNGK